MSAETNVAPTAPRMEPGSAPPEKPKRPLAFYAERGDRLLSDGKPEEALRLLTQGHAEHGDADGIVWRLADAEFRCGRPLDAKKRLAAAMAATPAAGGATSPYVYCAAGRLGRAIRDRAFAEQAVSAGLTRYPMFPELRYHAGVLFSDRDRHKEAAENLEVAVNLQPHYTAAMVSLGYSLEQIGEYERAEAVLRQAIGHAGTGQYAFNAHVNLANVLQRVERFEESLDHYVQAERFRKPSFLFSNRGAVERKLRRFDEAETSYRKAALLDPSNAGGYYNHGNMAKEVGRLDDAVQRYRWSLSVEPERASTHWNLSLALLAAGRLAEGFREYEWRWKYEGFPSRRRDFTQPMWDGKPFAGKTLLVHAEQGLGDHLQFARFIRPIAALGGKVVLECHGPLMSLFRGYEDCCEMVERLKPPADFDLHLPLLSAPLVLGVETLDDLPTDPFLEVPDDFVFPLPEADPERFKVGLIWGGNPEFSGDRERSAALDFCLPLIDVDGTQFFSLQKGVREADMKDAPAALVPVNERISDFRDTASIMKQMDLVITTCTSTAHLAGALGCRTWVMLHHNPDWRWLRHRADSPWYPNTRLFTQETPGDWPSVYAEAEKALRAEVAAWKPAGGR